jgi:hypothetical protein
MILLRLLILASILLFPAHLLAQQPVDVPKESSAVAHQELEAIMAESQKLDNKNAFVNIRSRAAVLVSFSDPIRSNQMFLEVWKFTNEQADKAFDKEQAKLVILKYLFPRNPKLARQLLAEQPKPEDSSLGSRATGRDDDQRLAGKLASQLVDTDPSAAAALLEKLLSSAASPAGMGALSRLREKDSFLSDYVAAKALDGLSTQPTLVSLPGLHLLGAYMFPGPGTVSSIEAESSLQLLQFKYFLASYDVLRASLKETNEALVKDQHYAQRDLQFRAAYQGQVAAILAALAPRLQPSLAAELNAIAAKLGPQVPASISQLSQSALARISGNKLASDDAEQNFVFAMSNGDFDEAGKQLDLLKDGEKKDIYAQLLTKNQARAFLAKSDVLGALTAIRKLGNPTTRLVMYLDALKVAKKKHDSSLTSIVVNEARLLVPQTDRNGLHVRALLSFVAQLTDSRTNDDAMEFLANAVIAINTLGNRTDEQSAPKTLAESAMAELNDPNSLLDAPEMEQAFSFVGLFDLDRSLAQAKRIEPRPVQLVARLETIEGIMKRIALRPKMPAKPTVVSSNPKQ